MHDWGKRSSVHDNVMREFFIYKEGRFTTSLRKDLKHMRESRISKESMRKYAHHRLRKHNKYMKNVPRHSIHFDHILNIVFKRTNTLLKDQVCKKEKTIIHVYDMSQTLQDR